MPFIQPNAQVNLISGYHGDRNYNHSVRFNTINEQVSYFESLIPNSNFVFNEQQYARYTKNSIRIPRIADDLYGCNYMMFRNKSFANKWFYAFIDSIEYVNNNLCEVFYTIDAIQTYWFDFEMERCFVEREHTESDNIGEHIIPEPFSPNINCLVNLSTRVFSREQHLVAKIKYVPDKDNELLTRVYRNDLGEITYQTQPILSSYSEFVGVDYSGLTECIAEAGYYDALVIQRATERIVEMGGVISDIIVIPDELRGILYTRYTYEEDIKINKSLRFINPATRQIYTPLNNKLYTNQFTKLLCDNNQGSTCELDWLMFDKIKWENGVPTAWFKLKAFDGVQPTINIEPTVYNVLGDSGENVQYSLPIQVLHSGVWAVDSYERWKAQYGDSFRSSVMSGAITSGLALGYAASVVYTGGATLAAAPKVIGAVGGTVSSITSAYNTYANARNTPNTLSGNIGNNALTYMDNRFGYYFYDMSINAADAKVIDDYFNMFGYQINEVKKPNVKRNGAILRPAYNYVKTNGAIVHQSTPTSLFPADVEQLICEIFDKGITFWEKDAPLGDYGVDNRPVNAVPVSEQAGIMLLMDEVN